jgi:hypothetical protein
LLTFSKSNDFDLDVADFDINGLDLAFLQPNSSPFDPYNKGIQMSSSQSNQYSSRPSPSMLSFPQGLYGARNAPWAPAGQYLKSYPAALPSEFQDNGPLNAVPNIGQQEMVHITSSNRFMHTNLAQDRLVAKNPPHDNSGSGFQINTPSNASAPAGFHGNTAGSGIDAAEFAQYLLYKQSIQPIKAQAYPTMSLASTLRPEYTYERAVENASTQRPVGNTYTQRPVEYAFAQHVIQYTSAQPSIEYGQRASAYEAYGPVPTSAENAAYIAAGYQPMVAAHYGYNPSQDNQSQHMPGPFIGNTGYEAVQGRQAQDVGSGAGSQNQPQATTITAPPGKAKAKSKCGASADTGSNGTVEQYDPSKVQKEKKKRSKKPKDTYVTSNCLLLKPTELITNTYAHRSKKEHGLVLTNINRADLDIVRKHSKYQSRECWNDREPEETASIRITRNEYENLMKLRKRQGRRVPRNWMYYSNDPQDRFFMDRAEEHKNKDMVKKIVAATGWPAAEVLQEILNHQI